VTATRLEVTEGEKHSSLLGYGLITTVKKLFYIMFSLGGDLLKGIQFWATFLGWVKCLLFFFFAILHTVAIS
jgi:hypothetical protein